MTTLQGIWVMLFAILYATVVLCLDVWYLKRKIDKLDKKLRGRASLDKRDKTENDSNIEGNRKYLKSDF